MYAIIEDQGRQYTVRTGDVIRIDRRDANEREQLTFDRVLMVRDEAEARVGTPTVAGAKVTATVMGEIKAAKIVVRKFKRRKGYRRKQGHRQKYTQVRIDSIEG